MSYVESLSVMILREEDSFSAYTYSSESRCIEGDFLIFSPTSGKSSTSWSRQKTDFFSPSIVTKQSVDVTCWIGERSEGNSNHDDSNTSSIINIHI